MAFRTINNSFSKGELDPALLARIDIDLYKKGCRRMRNMLSLWTGAARIAPGSVYIDMLVDRENSNAVISNAEYVKGIDFLYDADSDVQYTIVLRQSNTTSSAIDIYLGDTLNATVTTPTYTPGQIENVFFALGHDRVLFLHEQVQTSELVRSANAANAITGYTGGTTNTFTITAGVTVNQILPATFTATAFPTTTPQIDANETYFTYATTATTIEVYSNIEDAIARRNKIAISSAGTGANVIHYNTWTYANLTPVWFPTFDYTTLGGTQYRTAGFTFTPGATTGTGINLTASGAIFTDNHIGGIYRGAGGLARITAVTSSTVAVMTIIDDFPSTAAIAGNLSFLAEKMWTSGTGGATAGPSRGWPGRGSFFLNRLILGRSAALKNVCAISSAGVYDDFDDTDIDSTSSFSVQFNGRGEQTVQSIIADDSLIFTTSNKVFAQSPLVENPINATNFYFAPQTQAPSADIEAVTLDNQIFFVSGNKSQVNQLLYSTQDGKYMSYPIGLLSAHLFETINSNGTWEPPNIEARLYLATQDNGTMLMYNTLIQQNVSAWSLRNTRGKFKQVIANGRDCHTIVERQINLGTSTFETALDYAYLSNTTMTSWYDVQEAFESASGSATTVLENQYDYIVIGNDIPFTALDFTLDTNANTNVGLTFEYLDNNADWDTFSPTDNTTGFTSSNSVTWAFTDVPNWFPNDLNGIEQKYWVRIRRTTETVTTLPIIEQVQVNTGIRLFLERMSFSRYTDSTVPATSDASGNITGLSHLAGHQVYTIEDQFTSGPFFVNNSGAVTVDNLSADVRIGIAYKPELIPMPLYTPTDQGDNTYAQKYVQDLFIDYVDSLYIVAGFDPLKTDIPVITLGNYTLGQPVPPQSGYYEIHPRGNWDPRQEIIITQSQPGPMEIIGVGYHVETT